MALVPTEHLKIEKQVQLIAKTGNHFALQAQQHMANAQTLRQETFGFLSKALNFSEIKSN